MRIVTENTEVSLQKEGMNWQILTIRPGNDPFGNLADSINENIFSGDYEKELRDDILKASKRTS